MRNPWWMVPVAVCLVLFSVAGGVWLGRAGGPRPVAADPGGKVSVPGTSGTPGSTGGDKPSAGSDKPAAPPASPPKEEPKSAEPEQKRPADQDAIAYVQAFMRARMAGDAAKVATMLAPTVKHPGAVRVHTPGHRLTAYQLQLLGSGDPDAFLFRARVAFVGAQPGGEVAVEQLRVTWKGGLKVAGFEEAAKESIAAAAATDGQLYLSQGQATPLAADLAQLPEKFTPYGADPGVEFGVGRSGWAVAVPSLSGQYLFWSTKGLHPLVGVSKVSQAGPPTVTPLDLLFEGAVAEAAWAPGEDRYVALAQAWPSGGTGLEVWDITGPARFGPDLSKVAGHPDYTVRSIRWLSPTTVAFDIRVGGDVTGPWTYNVSTKALTPP